MPGSAGISILIIDDNLGDQIILEEEIKSTSLVTNHITTAESLSQAKQLLKDNAFSLIFLDLFLPDSLGLDSFTDLQKINPSTPIIIFSGLSDKKVALKAITLGAQDFLIKGSHSVEILEKTITYCIERKRNLETIKANTERYETLLKVTNDILWDWDLITDKVAWSGDGIKKYLTESVENSDIPYNFWVMGLHPDERNEVVKSISDAVVKKQKFWQCEYRFLRNDGSYDYIYSRGYILNDSDNIPVRMIGSMQDVTERKIADQKLALNEKRFKSLIQHSTDLIGLLDEQGNYKYVSDSSEKILGYSPGFFVGQNAFTFIHPDDLQKTRKALLSSINDDFVELKPYRFKNAHNEWRWLESTLVNMLNEEPLEGIIVNSRDITARVEAERQLEEANRRRQKEVTEAMMEGQERERSEIGRELHDNINQLLVATKLYIEMGMKSEDGSKALLKNAVNYTMGAIEEIRKLSKALITPLIKDIGLIESIGFLAEDIMHVHPIQITVEIDGFQQDELNEKFKLNVFRIVQEQVNNTIKHAHAKHINIFLQQTSERIYVSISDDGVGFDTGTRKRGIGLSNIHSRAALYKGNVTIASSPGNGCIMNIIFRELSLTAENVNSLV